MLVLLLLATTLADPIGIFSLFGQYAGMAKCSRTYNSTAKWTPLKSFMKGSTIIYRQINSSTTSAGYIAMRPKKKEFIVGFRGTTTKTAMLYDLHAVQVALDKDPSLKVHAGDRKSVV